MADSHSLRPSTMRRRMALVLDRAARGLLGARRRRSQEGLSDRLCRPDRGSRRRGGRVGGLVEAQQRQIDEPTSERLRQQRRQTPLAPTAGGSASDQCTLSQMWIADDAGGQQVRARHRQAIFLLLGVSTVQAHNHLNLAGAPFRRAQALETALRASGSMSPASSFGTSSWAPSPPACTTASSRTRRGRPRMSTGQPPPEARPACCDYTSISRFRFPALRGAAACPSPASTANHGAGVDPSCLTRTNFGT